MSPRPWRPNSSSSSSRKSNRDGKKAQLNERIQQLQEEINGLVVQSNSKDQEIAITKTELDRIRDLSARSLVPITRVTDLERDLAKLQGERGELLASTAQARGKITETDLQILQIDQDMRAQVGDELADVRTKMGELGERKIAAEDELKRIEIRAPQDGTVHELAVHTVGGVISPGDVIMHLVPDKDELRVEAKVPPQEIDRVSLGQEATLRFTSFDSRSTPQITGKVSFISAATSSEQKTGATYYTVHLSVSDSEIAETRPCPPAARDAGGGLCRDRRAHACILPRQADCRSARAGIERAIVGALPSRI